MRLLSPRRGGRRGGGGATAEVRESAAMLVQVLGWELQPNKRMLRRAGAIPRLVRLLAPPPRETAARRRHQDGGGARESAEPNAQAVAQLPPGWKQAWTPDGQPYYRDTTQGAISWLPPASAQPTLARASKRIGA
jgi:hypothetical protein